MRYIIRKGKARGDGLYEAPGCGNWTEDRAKACFWEACDQDLAEVEASDVGGRVVRLLTHEESKRKAAAKALRVFGKEMRRIMFHQSAGEAVDACASKEADSLWPRRNQ